MNTDSKDKILSGEGSRLATAEQRLTQLGIDLPEPPEPEMLWPEQRGEKGTIKVHLHEIEKPKPMPLDEEE